MQRAYIVTVDSAYDYTPGEIGDAVAHGLDRRMGEFSQVHVRRGGETQAEYEARFRHETALEKAD